MNQDIFAGQWKQMRDELKSWWGKLADDDFDRIGGQKDKLIGVLQEKYGYAREQAQQEVERRLKAYGDKMSDSQQPWEARRSGGRGRWVGQYAKRRPHRTGQPERVGWNRHRARSPPGGNRRKARSPRRQPQWRVGWNRRKARSPRRQPQWRVGWNRRKARSPRRQPQWRVGWNRRKARSPRRQPQWRVGWNQRAPICKRKNSKRWQPTSPP